MAKPIARKAIFGLTDVKVLLYMKQKPRPVRYSELLKKVAGSRGSLATSLLDLQKMGFVNRNVKATRPITTEYTLSENGSKVAQLLGQVKALLSSTRS